MIFSLSKDRTHAWLQGFLLVAGNEYYGSSCPYSDKQCQQECGDGFADGMMINMIDKFIYWGSVGGIPAKERIVIGAQRH